MVLRQGNRNHRIRLAVVKRMSKIAPQFAVAKLVTDDRADGSTDQRRRPGQRCSGDQSFSGDSDHSPSNTPDERRRVLRKWSGPRVVLVIDHSDLKRSMASVKAGPEILRKFAVFTILITLDFEYQQER
jgi:hypothetical protein